MCKMFKMYVLINSFFLVFHCWSMDQEGQVDHSVLELVHKYNIEKNKEYTQKINQPQLILLSGCAGMGKSTVANGLQKQTGMLLFDAYGSREVMRENNCFHVSMTAKKKVAKFLTCFTFFIDKVKEELFNNAIIFDESIDRKEPPLYTLVSEIAKQHQLPIFLIRLNVPKQIAFKRLMEREKDSKENVEHFEKHFDGYYKVYEEFGLEKSFDYVQNNASDDSKKCVDTELVDKVKKRIEFTSEKQ